MKNRITFLAMAFLLSVVAVVLVFVRADAARTGSQDVLAAERACAKAFVDSDVTTLDRCIANDYVEMIAEPASEGVVAHWRTQSKSGSIWSAPAKRNTCPWNSITKRCFYTVMMLQQSSPSIPRGPRRMVRTTARRAQKSIRGEKGTGIGR